MRPNLASIPFYPLSPSPFEVLSDPTPKLMAVPLDGEERGRENGEAAGRRDIIPEPERCSSHSPWGHLHMMSALGGQGGTPKADMRTDKLRECDSDKEEDSRNKTILWTSHVHAPPSSFVFCTFRSILLLLSLLRRLLEVFSSLFAVARAPDSSEGKKERREARSEGGKGE